MTAPGTGGYYALDSEQVLLELRSNRDGLSADEARQRLQRFGRNALHAAKPVSAGRILLDQLRSTVVLLLIVATGVSVAVGDMLEGAAIGAVLVINTVLGFVTEYRARRAMEALLRLESPRATAIRDGEPQEIDAHELVPGDVIQLDAGESVPADARLLEATDLLVNEASLTGESLPVEKTLDAVPGNTPLPDRKDMVYKGTGVSAGSARAVVTETGMKTELGRIGGLVGSIRDERTPLEHRLDQLGHRLVWLALAAGALVAALGWVRRLPLREMIETGIALAIAAVPEGLPAVATIAMAVGVHRMARRKALIRRLPSVETLGSVTVVCADKTGTLTAGEMTVTAYAFADRDVEVTGSGYEPHGEFVENEKPVGEPLGDTQLAEALLIGVMANRAEVERKDDNWVVQGDPTEAALLVAGQKAGLSRDDLLTEQPEVGEIPFSSDLMLMATFHDMGDRTVAFAKGAPEQIVERCARVLTSRGEQQLDDAGREALLEKNRGLASRGLRVLALASGPVTGTDDAGLQDLTFIALAGILDPAAPGVKETIRTLHDAGIRTVMITGDQKLTAQAIARELGILGDHDGVLEGAALAQIGEDELAGEIERVGAFSRVSPEDKLTIVEAYQRAGEIVAMLGDGVNDAPALKKADVGVAMGKRGTDVAKETAAVVLQDDRFQTIGAAVEEGRVIFDNIRKFVFYLFSCNLAEVGVLVVAGIAGLPVPLFPLQILWLNMVTDTFPALALAMEPAESDIMRRPPRDPEEAILSRRFVGSIAFYAALITAATLAAFIAGLEDGRAVSDRAVTMSFMTLALAQTFHLVNARGRISRRTVLSNRYAVGAVAMVLALQLIAINLTPLAQLLRIQDLAPEDWAIVLAMALAPAVVGQLIKFVPRR